MYQIAIVGGPAENYLTRCLDSLLAQTHKEWKACVILDPCGDNTINEASTYLKKAQDNRISIVINNKKMYALPNLLKAFKLLSAADSDILLTVDADDWLTDSFSLSIVDSYYKRYPEVLITYGSWMPYPKIDAKTNNQPYTEKEFSNLRKTDWRASHLRTFSHKLWRRIKDADLRDEKGEYFKSAWDLGFMFPMLEMAGYHRSKYISERIYTYNQETVYNDSKLRLKEQMIYTDYIANMAPYSYVENL